MDEGVLRCWSSHQGRLLLRRQGTPLRGGRAILIVSCWDGFGLLFNVNDTCLAERRVCFTTGDAVVLNASIVIDTGTSRMQLYEVDRRVQSCNFPRPGYARSRDVPRSCTCRLQREGFLGTGVDLVRVNCLFFLPFNGWTESPSMCDVLSLHRCSEEARSAPITTHAGRKPPCRGVSANDGSAGFRCMRAISFSWFVGS